MIDSEIFTIQQPTTSVSTVEADASILLTPPEGFAFPPSDNFIINFDVISLGDNASVLFRPDTNTGGSTAIRTVFDPGSYNVSFSPSWDNDDIPLQLSLQMSTSITSDVVVRITSIVVTFPRIVPASYEFILDTMGDVYQLQGIPSNSDADFWGYFNSTNRTAGADGAFPTSSTYWREDVDGNVEIRWIGSSIKSTTTGPTTSPYRVGNDFYYKGAEFYSSGTNTYFAIRRESVLSAVDEFDPNRTAQENTSDLTAAIVNTYPGTSRTSIYTLPPLVGRVEVDFTNIDFDGFDTGGLYSDRITNTFSSYSVNGSGSGTTAENAAQSFRDSIINDFEEGIAISVSGNVVTISSDISFLFGFIAVLFRFCCN